MVMMMMMVIELGKFHFFSFPYYFRCFPIPFFWLSMCFFQCSQFRTQSFVYVCIHNAYKIEYIYFSDCSRSITSLAFVGIWFLDYCYLLVVGVVVIHDSLFPASWTMVLAVRRGRLKCFTDCCPFLVDYPKSWNSICHIFLNQKKLENNKFLLSFFSMLFSNNMYEQNQMKNHFICHSLHNGQPATTVKW